MDIREVRSMIIQLKKVDFACCEDYIIDLIENYEYSPDEILLLKMELIQLYTGSRKYLQCFEMMKKMLENNVANQPPVQIEENVGSQPDRVKISIIRKMIHLAHISSQPVKDEILEELNDYLPFGDDVETQELIIEVLQNNKMNSKLYKVPEGLEEASANIENLVKWIEDGGGYTKGLEVRFFNDVYRGVFLTGAAKDTEVLSIIPHNYLITYERASLGKMWQKSQELGLKFIAPKHTVLGLFLIEERLKGEDSFWKYYLKSLPPNMNTMPVFYSEEQKDLLKGSPVLRTMNKRIKEMHHDYNVLKDNMEEFSQISYETFSYHRCLASSRVFGFIVNEVKTGGMVPFLDMINHKRPKQSLWSYDDAMESFKIEAYGNCVANAELFDSYGKKCNSRFLLNYGFIEEDNDANEYVFTLDFDETYPLYQEKADYIPQLEDNILKFKISKDFESSNFEEMMSFLRFCMIDDANELNYLIKTLEQQGMQANFLFNLSSLSKKNELQSLIFLTNLCEKCLSQYETSMEEDKVILTNAKATGLGENERNCVKLRMGEKEVLHELIKFSNSCQKLFNYHSNEIQMIIDHYPYKVFKSYITNHLYKILTN